jgi:Na+-transporting methylmalonyl-CoA/oxaloacetate decarboxylase gamma subunit
MLLTMVSWSRVVAVLLFLLLLVVGIGAFAQENLGSASRHDHSHRDARLVDADPNQLRLLSSRRNP